MALGGSLGLDVLNFDVGRSAMMNGQTIYFRMSPRACEDVAAERFARIDRLVTQRGMTATAAAIVVDAAMFGIGCLEGEVRARIEKEKLEQKH